MSEKEIQEPAALDDRSANDDTQHRNDDIVIDITNGKKVHVNLDPLEWTIIGVVAIIITVVTGGML